jgi:signal peptidase I
MEKVYFMVFQFIKEILVTFLLALIIVIPIRVFLFQPFLVKGQSMEPSFYTGDYLIVDEITYRFRDPKRGEAIVFKYPQNEKQKFIKRVVGLPNETVEINADELIVKNKKGETVYSEKNPSNSIFGDLKIQLEDGEFFVLGDNRAHSLDSRYFGKVEKKEIVGRVILRLFPPQRIEAFFFQ